MKFAEPRTIEDYCLGIYCRTCMHKTPTEFKATVRLPWHSRTSLAMRATRLLQDVATFLEEETYPRMDTPS